MGGTDPPFAGVSSDAPTPSSPRPRLVQLRPTGVLVSPVDDGHTELTLCALLGKDSIRLVSGDLLGERLMFWKTIENLLFVLESLCPLPPEFSHSLMAEQERCSDIDLTLEESQLESQLQNSRSPSRASSRCSDSGWPD